MFATLFTFAILAQDAPTPSAPATIADDLRAAIALATPKERRTAALVVARRKDVTLQSALAAIEEVSVREEATHGPHVERAPIYADGKIEDVELVVYVPKSYDPHTPAPLIESFHGTGGSGKGEDVPWRATSEKLGAIVVAPSEAGANEGYAFSMRERDAAIGALRWANAHFAIDPDRVYATGISRGGHLTWDVALRRPDRYAALAPLIGCPRFQMVRGQNNLRFLENLVRVPIRDLQGSKDDPGVLQNLHEAFAKLESLQAVDAKLIEFEKLGHAFDFGAVDWPEFFGRAVRDPNREHVVFTTANLEEARSSWVEVLQFGREVAENPRLDVQAAAWTKLDAAGQRRFVEDQIEKDTARIEATRTAKGHFTVEAKGVTRFRLLLSADVFDPAVPVEITFQGKVAKRKVAFDPRVLFAEYVERLDRSFLPVAAVEFP